MSGKYEVKLLERADFGDVTVIRLKTPQMFDDDVMKNVFDLIYRLVDAMGRNKLVLNLAVVEYLPSMGLGKMVMLNRKVQTANGRLALCDVTPTLLKVLETTHLTGVFEIFATEEEAVQSFSE